MRSFQIVLVAIRVVKGWVGPLCMVECIDRHYYSRIFGNKHVVIPAVLLGAVGNTVWYPRSISQQPGKMRRLESRLHRTYAHAFFDYAANVRQVFQI
jgi:hypothetical protein